MKVSSTHLTDDGENGYFGAASWHVEGMPYERIIASGIHYLTVDGITDSYLEFRKPVILNELHLDYPQSNDKFPYHHYGTTGFDPGKMNRYLGLIKCQEGSSVVFPNSLQHHVKEFELAGDAKFGTRVILCFFLIDPETRIVSTADVDYQQADGNPEPKSQIVFTREEAEHYRKELMFCRKYFVDVTQFPIL